MFDPTRFPSLGTRKALLAIDLQNDFLSPDGALPVTEPEGFVKRIVDLASAFRQSGAGDVIWVRSEYERPRPANDDQIVVTDGPPLSIRPGAQPRGRRRTSREPSEPPENDPEAFLSRPPQGEGRACVQPGSAGVEAFADIAAAIEPKDYRLTKTHYSAFQTGQLLQLLRGRFATEIYICGALTNTSVYATALAAGSYGYDIKIVDDCCGYRSIIRHAKATRQLIQLTGCELLYAEDVIQSLLPSSSSKPEAKLEPAISSPSSPSRVASSSRGRGGKSPIAARTIIPVRSRLSSPRSKAGSSAPPTAAADAPPPPPPPPAASADAGAEQLLPASMEKLKLSGESSSSTGTVVAPDPKSQDPQPQAAVEPLQPVVSDDDARATLQVDDAPKPASAHMRHDPVIEPANPLDADSDSGSPIDSESFEAQIRARVAARRQSRGVERADQRIKDSPPQEWRSPASSFKRTRISAEFAKEKVQEAIASKDTIETESKESKPADKPQHSPPESENTKPPTAKGSSSDDSSAEEADAATEESQDMDKPIVSEPICEGDTTVIQNVLPPILKKNIFERVCGEVQWQRMMHQGGEVPRLVAVQGEVDSEGNQPVYRHPSDEAPVLVPFSPTVLQIKEHVEKHLGHPVNHVLIQFYRGGNDYISEHSDKTIDVVPDSFIANVSLGAERTMVFRTKRADRDPSKRKTESVKAVDSVALEQGVTTSPDSADKTVEEPRKDSSTSPQSKTSAPVEGQRRQVERAHLPHNSLCRMGLRTNEKWLHAIRQDKRLDREKTEAELAYEGGRISLTFRRIGTFLNRDSTLIWGQGATGKTKAAAHAVVNGQTPEAVRMLQAFGRENQSSAFDWKASYGAGFDVLHLSASPRFFASGDDIVDTRVTLMLAAYDIKYAKGSVSPGFSLKDSAEVPDDLPVKFVDNDAGKSTVTGDVAIMLYLASTYGGEKETNRSGPALARLYSRFQAALGLEAKWRALLRSQARGAAASKDSAKGQHASTLLKSLRRELTTFASWADEAGAHRGSIAGEGDDPATVADYALWPVLHDMARVCRDDGEALSSVLRKIGLDGLQGWYTSFASRESVKAVMGDAQPEIPAEETPKKPNPTKPVEEQKKEKEEEIPTKDKGKGKIESEEEEDEAESEETEKSDADNSTKDKEGAKEKIEGKGKGKDPATT
ncbi:putative isochorismatase family protein family protein [Phaeoacremonium minimum UCRPA7]|uniref:Putative isochorismatase family protein family protein n=1 Tax=Phaeoacremonium minimum (strain UCR-PA7) TaxID=1286976 RepID=R8BJG4_PHAM7|nr:putative isochorismatase family protein family protein [Phaeoacremonium minimum UCRPA7]EON99456.1 putative isochorismatase family protein family protein [Phaeoacremonium minimum UCRPA7]